MPTLIVNDHSYRLQRYPRRPNELLQPWDAADEYLLQHYFQTGSGPAGSILLINDAFGALATALFPYQPVSWNDSYLSRRGLEHNLILNGLDQEGLTFVPGDKTPEGPFSLVLMKIPKSLAQLEDILQRLRPALLPGSRLVAGGMIKHTPARVFRLMEKIIGSVQTSLGWKKARLAFADFDPRLESADHRPDDHFLLEEFGWEMTSRPGIFSGDHLDLGTRLLVQHLPTSGQPLRIADLGCGNGILALALGRLCPEARILGVDESYRAVASARDNLSRTGLTDRKISFQVADGLTEVESASLDLVVCNPPFHLGRATGDHLAWRMFEQAKNALVSGGELRLVGNRHLEYHKKLGRLFGNCEVLGSDRKFVVLRATR